ISRRWRAPTRQRGRRSAARSCGTSGARTARSPCRPLPRTKVSLSDTARLRRCAFGCESGPDRDFCRALAPRFQFSGGTDRGPFRALAAVIVAASLAGCAALEESLCTPHCNSSQHSSSSLVEFLYPNGQVPPADNSIPELHVPLRVGLAFLPARGT